MCFSAPASFVAGTTLCAIGIATVKQTKANSESLFASVPLFLGLQQLVEGGIWLTFDQETSTTRVILTYAYLGFAYAFWPFYVPFAVATLERVSWRKRALSAFAALGAALGLYIFYFVATAPPVAKVVEEHIVYSPYAYKLYLLGLYILATNVSCLFSSRRFVNFYGVLSFACFLAADRVATVSLFSVWCFFAAALSVSIFLYFRYWAATDRAEFLNAEV